MTDIAISQAAIDLIVDAEVTSKAVYDAKYRKPTWPKGQSGVTIGIGYDCGYASKQKIAADWAGLIPEAMIAALLTASGVTGLSAQGLSNKLRDAIDVPWDPAMAVFLKRDIPEWTKAVCDDIPGANNLSPDCLGALVSLAYNRGASFTKLGDRYAEMRAVRAHIMAGQLSAVPADIRAMKRLWGSDQRGLLIRRDNEAALFERGLSSKNPQAKIPSMPPDVPAKKPAPPKPAPTKPPGTVHPAIPSGGIGAVVATLLHLLNVPTPLVILGGIVVAVAVLFVTLKKKG